MRDLHMLAAFAASGLMDNMPTKTIYSHQPSLPATIDLPPEHLSSIQADRLRKAQEKRERRKKRAMATAKGY